MNNNYNNDWCPENDGAYRAELAHIAKFKKSSELENMIEEAYSILDYFVDPESSEIDLRLARKDAMNWMKKKERMS